MKGKLIGSWIAQVMAAVILGMAGFMKLSGAPDSVALFEVLGAEPMGRLALGSVELLTVVLLLVPRTAAVGGVMAAGVTLGAVGTHLFKIGISYGGDPSLFIMASVTLLAGATVAFLRKDQLPLIGKM